MKAILFAIFITFSIPANTILPITSVPTTAVQEIEKPILDKIMELAAGEWGVSEESLWVEYDNGSLTIIDLGEGSFELHSAANGGPLIIVVEDHS